MVSADGPITNLDAIIIDDEGDICELCKEYIDELGIFRHVVVAQDGITATAKLNNQSFGLILLDMKMPKKSGLDILKHIRSMSNNKPEKVVIISGELDKNKMAEALKCGCKNVIIKPFTKESFQEKIKMICTANLKIKL